jgi:hypothetical protein
LLLLLLRLCWSCSSSHRYSCLHLLLLLLRCLLQQLQQLLLSFRSHGERLPRLLLLLLPS